MEHTKGTKLKFLAYLRVRLIMDNFNFSELFVYTQQKYAQIISVQPNVFLPSEDSHVISPYIKKYNIIRTPETPPHTHHGHHPPTTHEHLLGF